MTSQTVARVGTMLAGAVGALVVSGLVSPPQGFAQSASSVKPKFEVASIRLAAQRPDGRACTRTSRTDEGRVEVGCTSLYEILGGAGIPATRLVAPEWMQGGQKFDISAKLPDGATTDQIPQMYLSLLEDRFGLVFHREIRDRPILALVVAKGGLKVQSAAPESAQPAWVAEAAAKIPSSGGMLVNGTRARSLSVQDPDGGQMTILQTPSMGFVRRSVRKSDGMVSYEAPSITFEGLVDIAFMSVSLARLDEELRDMTGLKGRYQLNLEVAQPDLNEIMRARGDQTLVQGEYLRVVQDGLKKLGLQLEPRKAPVELFVIDRLEKTPTEN